MKFMFPMSQNHLPNENQLRLLVAMTLDTDIPGFLHENALAVTKNDRDENKRIINYYVTAPEAVKTILNHPYLYVPFDLPKTYIMSSHTEVHGFVVTGTLLTYWFEKPISIYEIYTAEGYKIPLVCRYVHIGRSESCTLCGAHGALDWVNESKATQKYRPVPRKRFVVASHRYHYYLIDNNHIVDYDGEHFIQPCPKCMGIGCNSVLHMLNDKIEGMNFGKNSMYHLLFVGARETLIEMPYLT
jgi:hypothetical protein